jgi:hypothetical protein
MKSSAVANNATIQPSLWDVIAERGLPQGGATLDAFPLTCTLPFHNASLTQVQCYTRYLYGAESVNHRLVSYRVNVLDAWLEDGTVWAKCLFWPEGAYVNELRAGLVVDEEEDEL